MTVTFIEAVHDGEHPVPSLTDFFTAPPSAGVDWPTASPWFGDGPWILPMGGHLLRSSDRLVLVDAGLGPDAPPGVDSGHLPDSLRALGVSPEQITDVVLTHLHFDHVGWVARDGQPVFTRAHHHVHRADWERVRTDPDPDLPSTGVHDVVRSVSDLLHLVDGERTDLADSVALRLFPGHTPGNCIVEVDTPDGPVLLLGDTAHHPLLLVEDGWIDNVDQDHVAAARARDRIAEEMERTGAIGIGAHFPGRRGGRITRDGHGRRRWNPLPAASTPDEAPTDTRSSR